MIEFLVSVFAWPAAMMWRHPGNQMLVFLVLVVLMLVAFIAKRFEKTSDFARISKRVILIGLWGFYVVWLPATVIPSVIWIGGH